MDPRITRILGKLETLRGRGPETFGASTHGYQLSPPLAEAEVAALEAKLGVALPEAYRLFLREIGVAGMGPYYGLLPPERWLDTRQSDTDVEMPDFASRPCLWTVDSPRNDATYDAITKDVTEPYQGMIAIADQGCAYYVALATAGPALGRILYVNGDGGSPFFPENADFLSWYERWVDELSWGFEHNWFGMQMPGDEATFASLARSADEPRRIDALFALWQVPVLATETQEAVALRVRDTDPKVRTAALNLAKAKKLIPAIESHVRKLLTDDDSSVRQSALAAIIDAKLDWHDAARAALADPNENVVCDAVQALQRDKAVTEAEVLMLLTSTSDRIRSNARDIAKSIKTLPIFDALAAEPGPDDAYDRRLYAMLAQVDAGTLDDARRAVVFARVKARLAAETKATPPTVVLSGLKSFGGTEPEAVQILIGMLQHPEPFYRYDAAGWLGHIGDADALPALRKIVDDPAMAKANGRSTSWSVGANAQKAIEKIEQSIAKRS